MKENLTDLQKENDELRASNSNLRKELKYFTDRVERGTITSKATYNRFMVALSKTPVQSLAEVKAQSVMDAASKLFSYGCDADSREALANYANQLKEG